ncbi:hypothetical protein JKF63_03810 [Porcisia hertigi]|uniref:Leishmanolysin n=1 Tax=Porcisia hertigi TaxID=2761500 RepID=A0A836IH75_9TRYP|nr:hypothetical protein JKF63_03810 [Porcisia hertigi]
MAPVMGAGYYTALTMAIFEDTSFYKADFSKAEVMPWDHNASCDLLKKNITQWPEMFCNRTEPGIRCTSSRLGVGQCDLVTHTHVLVDYFQHFTNVWLRGSSLYMDYCPVVEANRARTCNQNPASTWADVRILNVFSDAGRCIDLAFLPKGASVRNRADTPACVPTCSATTQRARTASKCIRAAPTWSARRARESRSLMSATPSRPAAPSRARRTFSCARAT